MEKYSLIANTGIHIAPPFEIEIDTKGKFNLWFYEWYDTKNGEWTLELVQEVPIDSKRYFFKMKDLYDYNFISIIKSGTPINLQDLYDEGVFPLMIDDKMEKQVGEIFKLNFLDRACALSCFENVWLPIPYFYRKTEQKFSFEALNWARFKLIPIPSSSADVKKYKVLVAFDTRTKEMSDKLNNEYKECPVFPDQFTKGLEFAVCQNEFQLMDYCAPDCKWDYINKYLFGLVHPGLESVGRIKSGRKTSYVASYFLLIDYIAQNQIFPDVVLYRDKGDNIPKPKDIDMVVDIGNSKTTALLREEEDNFNFNQVYKLRLVDFTAINNPEATLTVHDDPFEMRVALRKVNFGDFGIHESHQFVYPSMVRLGDEAITLIHKATETDNSKEKYSTMSSPKRYLWDGKRSREEWQFITLEGEKDNHILNIPGISEQLQSDGSVVRDGVGGQSYHYSRRSMMTFAFLEMLVQAETQINEHKYRKNRGDIELPRRIRRMVVTCPTAMSKFEREALVGCASDAVRILNKFNGTDNKVDIIPLPPVSSDKDGKWYYDEATCSQLIYIYGEVGYKYKGCCQEFFNLYGKKNPNTGKNDITIGSLDIGAGTSDLMICRYSYTAGDTTTITPDPIFYDSFYYAGDDMLNELIRNIMFFSPTSALRKQMKDLSEDSYRQKLRDFFGPDHPRMTTEERHLRRDFNLQYSLPLMYKFLELLSNNAGNCVVRYRDIFTENEPNERVKSGFAQFFGFSIEQLEWRYDSESVTEIVNKAFEPLLKKIATIMHTYNCDVILLSGRPSSLPPIRSIFLKYYSVSPNRLILLNNYYVGHWYPFTRNTGYITDPKTIVAVGALIGYYATTLGKLDKFLIDKTKLDEKLRSIINYIEASHDGLPIEYFITPQKHVGQLMVSSLPTPLNIRQLCIDSYPPRKLFMVDFNYNKISEKISVSASEEGMSLTDVQVLNKTMEEIDNLRLRMPFHLEIEQDDENKESLTITSVTDKNGNDMSNDNIEISVRSLGIDDKYWLDTGAFEIL